MGSNLQILKKNLACNSCSDINLNLTNEPKMIEFIILGLILIGSLIFLKFSVFKSGGSIKYGKSIIFCGSRDSGKTTLLSRIVNKSVKKAPTLRTQTSQIQNTYPFGLNDSYNLVDIPGHERVRMQILEKHIKDTKALIFVIDAENTADDTDNDLRDSAEYFINILGNPELYSRTPKKDQLNILIICNKQDSASAKSSEQIKKQLQNEIQILKDIYSVSSQSSGGVRKQLKNTSTLDNDQEEVDRKSQNINKIFFESEGDFKFEDLDNFNVKFLGTSCVDEEFDFSGVDIWLNNMVSA